MKLSRVALAVGCGLMLGTGARAEVRLPHVISDHAVLQRNRPIHIWGWSAPNAHLTAQFHGHKVQAVANALGEWSLWLSREGAGGPYTLAVSGDGPEVVVTDLLVGDVWVASGQSNMEMPLEGFPGNGVVKDAAQEIAAATNPKLRLLRVEHKSSDFPLHDELDTWTTCTPETARKFSAVAYFFGREIAAKEDVPVGLIDSTWGGTPADSWMSMDTLGTNAALLPAFASRARFADEQADMEARIAAEKAEDAAAQAAGQPKPPHPWHPQEESWVPAGLYNGMIAPLTPLSVRGFIWYQGETNSALDRAPYYESLFSALIGDWRAHFAQGNLPFLYVQISSFNSPGEDWGRIRDAERRVLEVANTAMAVTLDVGTPNLVHPPDKQTVGHRLALGARHIVYGEDVAYASPLFREATAEVHPDETNSNVGAMRVWFDHGEGLTVRGAESSTAFEIAGADHHFVPARARIEGSTVVVGAPEVAHPAYVRYGWMGVMPDNIFNAAGLPMSTFTSDRF